MPIVAALPYIAVAASAAGAVATGEQQRKSASQAADASSEATQAANDLTLQQFQQIRGDLQPYTAAGINARNVLMTGDFSGGAGAFLDDMYAGVGDYMKQLEGLDFQFDPEDELYKWRQSENSRQVNQFMASRGGYDSRAAANMLLSSGMQLQSEEINNQYQRKYLDKYSKLMDLSNMSIAKNTNSFNMAKSLADQNLNKLMGIYSIGANAAAQTANQGATASNQMVNALLLNGSNQQDALLQKGAATAGTYNALASAPMNAMIMNKLLS